MAFTLTDSPIASHTLATDQPLMEANNQYYQGSLGKDHQLVFGHNNTTAFEGRHLQVSLSNRHGAAPTITDGANIMLYADNGNLFYVSANGAGNFQLTTFNAVTANFGGTGTTSTTTPFAGALASTNAGWTSMPGGLIVQYGTINNPPKTQSVNYPILFPTVLLGIFFNLGRNGSSSTDNFWVETGGTNNLGTFTFKGSTSGADVLYWYAIGK